MQKKLHIKIGDTVKVLSGEEKGKEGKVLTIDRTNDRAIIEGVNIVKKHVKPSSANPQGGIEEAEAGVHVSNLMLVVNGEATRVGRKLNDKGKRVRYSKKTGEVID